MSGAAGDDREYGKLYPVARAILTPLFKAGWRIHVTGAENVPDEGPAIICPNHTSVLDSFFLPSVLPRRITFVGKAEYLDDWKTKYLFPAIGMIPIDRSGGDAGARALDAAAGVLERGELFGIYPEGTRSRDGRLHKGHTGPARLALRTGAPLVPVGIVGTRDIQPPGAKAPRLFGAAEIRIGRPIDPAPARRPGRRPAGPPPAHRRADVRDPRAVGPGVRRRVRHPPPRGAAVAADRDRARQHPPPRPGAGGNRFGSRLRGSVTSAPMAEIAVTLPDGSQRSLPSGTTAVGLAQTSAPASPRPPSSPRSTATSATWATELADGDRVAIVTADSERGLYTIRHSTAHVLAQAVLDLFPGATFGIGPPVEDGFYYDFELPGGATFSSDDLDRIDARMREIIDERQAVRPRRDPGRRGPRGLRRPPVQAGDHRRTRRRPDVGHRRAGRGPHLREPAGQAQGPPAVPAPGFVDLCRGPHVPDTGRPSATSS